tara:strand:+ start:1079 stop:2143 length:1065 start_codon:yes stop_codon:yes gene_type:complete
MFNTKTLREYVAEGKLTESELGELSLFNYTMNVQFDGHWDPVTLACRGLVMNTKTDEVVARPFDKFFNFGERTKHLPDPKGAVIMEKYDGCLGIVFHHDGDWYITTRGSFYSEQAEYAREKFLPELLHGAMDPDHTYLFEIIFNDRIIGALKYDFEGLVLLGIRHKVTGDYVPEITLDGIALRIGAYVPKFHDAFVDKTFVSTLADDTTDREGVVVVYRKGLRLKFKTDRYKLLHHLYHGISDKQLAIAVATGTARDLLIEMPEEYRNVIEDRIEPLIEYRNQIYESTTKIVQQHEDLDQRSFAIAIQHTVPKYLQAACFQLRHKSKLKAVYLRKLLIERIRETNGNGENISEV